MDAAVRWHPIKSARDVCRLNGGLQRSLASPVLCCCHCFTRVCVFAQVQVQAMKACFESISTGKSPVTDDVVDSACCRQQLTHTEKGFIDRSGYFDCSVQSKQPSRSFAFPSMNREQRRMVHELAEAYGCETQSYDYEPNKNVVATAFRCVYGGVS